MRCNRSISLVAAAALATLVLLTACQDPPLPTDPTLAPIGALASAHTGHAVVERASGAAQFRPPDGDLRTFAFTALRRADGTVTGQWERIRRFDGNASETKAHGVVTCFTVQGNRVSLGGYATSGRFSERPTNGVVWSAVDNGQGRHSPPDLITLQFANRPDGFAEDYCNDPDMVNLHFFELAAGNITIR